ncbi:MAG: hypothetical protein AAF612_07385 [Planctomycetota bacterium]
MHRRTIAVHRWALTLGVSFAALAPWSGSKALPPDAEAHLAELAEPTALDPIHPADRRHASPRDPAQGLGAIDPPRVGDADDLRRFLDELARVTETQPRRSAADPQTSMLADAGRRDFHVLIEAMSRPALRLYAIAAAEHVADASHRPLVIAHLVRQPLLMSTITARGWEHEARYAIAEALMLDRARSPWRWAEALVNAGDPATHDALRMVLARAGCNRAYYDLIAERAGGVFLDDVVRRAWRDAVAAPTNHHQLQTLAQIAAGHGCLPALAWLVDALPSNPAQADSGPEAALRQAVLRRLPVEGSNEQLKAWFEANRNRVTFDATSGRYVVIRGFV